MLEIFSSMLLNFVESCLIFRQDEATFYFMLLKLHTVSNQHQSGLQCSFAIFYSKKKKKKMMFHINVMVMVMFFVSVSRWYWCFSQSSWSVPEIRENSLGNYLSSCCSYT